MAFIGFSDALITRVFNSSTNALGLASGSVASLITGGNVSVSQLIIYKGSVPSYPSFTDSSSRDSDILITFNSAASGVNWESVGIVNGLRRYLIGKYLTPATASASGTASWFLMRRAGTSNLTDKGSAIGNIGLIGSGADLEIPSLNIISGNSYQIAGLYINIPANYTVP